MRKTKRSSPLASIHPHLEREVHRAVLQSELAQKLLLPDPDPSLEFFQEPVDYKLKRFILTPENCLLDTETGEILECQPGENPERYFAALSLLGADPRYHWMGSRAPSDARGEVDCPLSGSSWHPTLPSDPSYMARSRVEARKRVTEDLERCWKAVPMALRARKEVRKRFKTVTIPRRDSVDWVAEWDLFNGMFERIRLHPFWLERVLGGVKSVENAGKRGQMHGYGTMIAGVHGHIITISKFFPQICLAWIATEAYVAERAHRGDPMENDPLHPWKEKGWTVEHLDTLASQSVDLKKKIRKSRTLEEQGYYQDQLGQLEALLSRIRKDLLVVDVRLVTNETREDTIKEYGEGGAVDELVKYVTKTTTFLESPRESLISLLSKRAPRTFDPFGLARDSKNHPGDPVGEAMKAAGEGAEGPAASLDTAAILSAAGSEDGPSPPPPEDGEGSESGTDPPPEPPKKPRPPSWRKLMLTMTLSEFIAAMRDRAERQSFFALKRIREAGIHAVSLEMVLLDGKYEDPFTAASKEEAAA